MSNKRYFREPIQEIYDAARYLDAAVSAHLNGHYETAVNLFKLANDPKVWDWADSIWGAKSKYVQVNKQPSLHIMPREKARMPDTQMRKALHTRDGYHCRFCGIPVIHADIRKYLHKIYPDAIPWGKTNTTQHAAFQCMWLQYDHVVPHSAGGENTLDNLVVTCSPCNFGKMEFLLEEINLSDPRDFAPIQSQWDGLERIMKVKTSCPQVKITKNSESCEEDSKEVKPKQNKWGVTEYVNFINEQNQPIVSAYLLDLVEFFKSRPDLFYIKLGSGKSPSIVIQNSLSKSICTMNKENFLIALTLPSQIAFVNTLREKYDNNLKWSLPFEMEKWPTLKTLSNLKPSDFGLLKEFILAIAISAKDLNE